MSRSCWLPAALLVAVACASTDEEVEVGVAGLVPGEDLQRGADVLVLKVPDGTHQVDTEEPQVAKGSGNVVRGTLRQQLTSAGFTVVAGSTSETDLAWDDAADLRCAYMVEASITGWRDTTRGWRELPDRIELRLRVWRVADRELVAYAREEIEGNVPEDSAETPHRLAQQLVSRALTPILEGRVLDEVPEDARPVAEPEEA